MIRLARVEDRESLLNVAICVYGATYSYLFDDPAMLARRLDAFRQGVARDFDDHERANTWVLDVGGAVVGIMQTIAHSIQPITHVAQSLEVRRLYLLPQMQGKGWAQTFLKRAATDARQTGCRSIWLDVVRSAEIAQKAYRNFGLEAVGEIPLGWGANPSLDWSIVMVSGVENATRSDDYPRKS